MLAEGRWSDKWMCRRGVGIILLSAHALKEKKHEGTGVWEADMGS